MIRSSPAALRVREEKKKGNAAFTIHVIGSEYKIYTFIMPAPKHHFRSVTVLHLL
jgi:aryl-phospho-beta-D-glucosidase BglC (GH1 family)